MYEPFVAGLSEYLLIPLPSLRARAKARESWRATPRGRRRREVQEHCDAEKHTL